MSARPHDWEAPVSLPEVSKPQRVLVAFDGSHNSERALAWAAYVARKRDIEVVVVVAYEQPLTMRGRGAPYIETITEQMEDEAKELANEAVGLLRDRGLAGRGIVIKGDVPRAILDTVESEACELVLIGRQGVSAEIGGVAGAIDKVRDMLQGGVSDKVVRHASVPVVVVP
jgi:nucleotide-binding universal stress UspA family protein